MRAWMPAAGITRLGRPNRSPILHPVREAEGGRQSSMSGVAMTLGCVASWVGVGKNALVHGPRGRGVHREGGVVFNARSEQMITASVATFGGRGAYDAPARRRLSSIGSARRPRRR